MPIDVQKEFIISYPFMINYIRRYFSWNIEIWH
jgi:hypothetical protein